MLKVHRIFVSWQGKLSRALLAGSRHGIITGTTSRGIFIRLDTDWIVFLSYESFHGPLTLNLSGELSILQGVKVNHKVMIGAGKSRSFQPGSRLISATPKPGKRRIHQMFFCPLVIELEP